MRKSAFIFVALMAYPTCAQILSGTVIVINRTQDQSTVAADSRVIMSQLTPMSLSGPIAMPPNDSYCKIAALKNQIIFTAVGYPERLRRQDGAVIFSAFDEARSAVNDAKTPMGEARLEEITNNWCARMRDKWTESVREDYLGVMQLARSQNDHLVGGIFAEASEGKIYVRAANVTFNESALLAAPIACSLIDLSWISCGQAEGKQINIDGHSDVANNFCSERKPDSKISAHTSLRAANRYTRLATQLVEITIDAYGKNGDVGGNVDVVTLSKTGRITWNSNPDCTNNKDHHETP